MIYYIEYAGRTIVEANNLLEAKDKFIDGNFIVDEKEMTYIYDEANPEFTNEDLEDFISKMS